jgi:hypothetical protein
VQGVPPWILLIPRGITPAIVVAFILHCFAFDPASLRLLGYAGLWMPWVGTAMLSLEMIFMMWLLVMSKVEDGRKAEVVSASRCS